MIRIPTSLLAGLLFLAALSAPAGAADKVPAYVAAAVADPSRPELDTQRDPGRLPAETVAFVGVKPGDKVAELIPGGGYFTRILAKVVGPKGHVYAISTSARGAGPSQAIAADPAYANVSVVVGPLADLKLPEPVDVVWTTENYHDLHNPPGADMGPINKAVFAALKPGGVYFVLDHVAAPDASAEDMRTLHRIDPAIVKREVLAAGFVLAGESDLLRNTTDTHTVVSHDPTMHDKTDRFALKFRKPK
jgi:predicted methyltransferase